MNIEEFGELSKIYHLFRIKADVYAKVADELYDLLKEQTKGDK